MTTRGAIGERDTRRAGERESRRLFAANLAAAATAAIAAVVQLARGRSWSCVAATTCAASLVVGHAMLVWLARRTRGGIRLPRRAGSLCLGVNLGFVWMVASDIPRIYRAYDPEWADIFVVMLALLSAVLLVVLNGVLWLGLRRYPGGVPLFEVGQSARRGIRWWAATAVAAITAAATVAIVVAFVRDGFPATVPGGVLFAYGVLFVWRASARARPARRGVSNASTSVTP